MPGVLSAALLALGVFALAVVFNWLAARVVRRVADGDRWGAAWADLLLGVVGLAFLWSVVEVGWWTAAPELAGGFLGTLLGTGQGEAERRHPPAQIVGDPVERR